MTKAVDKEPTEEDAKAAIRTLERFKYNEAMKDYQAKQPLRDILASEAFSGLQGLIANLPDELRNDRMVAPYLGALNSGMEGLRNYTPKVEPTPPPTEGTNKDA